MTEADTLYYRRRADQARRLADRAADTPARHAHMTMASRYEELAEGRAVDGAGSHIVERG